MSETHLKSQGSSSLFASQRNRLCRCIRKLSGRRLKGGTDRTPVFRRSPHSSDFRRARSRRRCLCQPHRRRRNRCCRRRGGKRSRAGSPTPPCEACRRRLKTRCHIYAATRSTLRRAFPIFAVRSLTSYSKNDKTTPSKLF